METIYLSLGAQVAMGTFFLKSPVSYIDTYNNWLPYPNVVVCVSYGWCNLPDIGAVDLNPDTEVEPHRDVMAGGIAGGGVGLNEAGVNGSRGH